mmetsp:Transcript_933/g.2805  ORF Transcript_933/g.2805 Transcript_933/m.2805 type:complete len:288 (-) Transcript_933:206-1069(-)
MGVTYSAVQFLASDGSNVREARSLLYRFSWSSALLLLLYAALLEMQRRRCVGSAEEAASTRWSLPACILTRRAIVTIVLGLLFCADALLSVWAARSMAMSAIFACALSNTLTVTLYSGREVWLLAMLQRTRLGVTTQHLLVAASASIILVKLLTAAALWKVARRLSTGDLAELAVVLRVGSSSREDPAGAFSFSPAADKRGAGPAPWNISTVALGLSPGDGERGRGGGQSGGEAEASPQPDSPAAQQPRTPAAVPLRAVALPMAPAVQPSGGALPIPPLTPPQSQQT